MKNSALKSIICLFLVIQSTQATAHNKDDDIPIHHANELVVWCQHEVELVYLRQGAQRRYAVFQHEPDK